MLQTVDLTKFWVFQFPLLGFREEDVTFKMDNNKHTVFITAKRTDKPECHQEVNTTVQLPMNIDMTKLKINWFVNGLIMKAPYTTPMNATEVGCRLLDEERSWKSNRARLSLDVVPPEIKILLEHMMEMRKCTSSLPMFLELVRDPITQCLMLQIDFKMRAFTTEELKVTHKKQNRTLLIEGKHEVKCQNICHTFMEIREEFMMPEMVNLDKMQSKMLPNCVFRVTMPVILKNQDTLTKGIEVPVKIE